ncbi:MAG: hypothetical protein GY906_18755 [bacterium]|nr:hypothetical protein [bacterium]
MDRSSRRRYRRYDVKGVDGAFVVRIDVSVINLSAAGMAIETQNSLIVGRSYSFRINHSDREMDVAGRVMWCVLGKTKRAEGGFAPIFRAGVQFEDVLSETTLQLQRVIENSAVLDPGAQIFGRFVSEVSGVVDDQPQAQFEVKKISLSGMLVDADVRPRKDDVVPFEITLGESPFGGHGRIAYIDPYPKKDTSRYRVGIEFALLSDTARDNLEEFLSSLISLNESAESA